jgi:predicted kinase
MVDLVIMRGLPASGKSTIAATLAAQGHVRVCKDDIRSMLRITHGVDESTVHALSVASVRTALGLRRPIVVDCTHIRERDVAELVKLAQQRGDITVKTHVMRVGPTECIERDAKRIGTARVGEEPIMRMWKQSGWQGSGYPPDTTLVIPPRFERRAAQLDEQLPVAFICDLDGTAAIIGDRSPYDASRCDIVDSPCPAVVRTTSALIRDGLVPIFVSGRSELHRDATERFIEKHYPYANFPATTNNTLAQLLPPIEFGAAVPHLLHMRSASDQRPDDMVKADIYASEIYGKFNVIVVFDDRLNVVRFWRSIGLTVMQLDDREF